jgi:anti-anti-sigma regulatory factor
MHDGNGAAGLQIVLDPAADDLATQVRHALTSDPERTLIVDLRAVHSADPALLRALRGIADQARVAGRPVFITRPAPAVYKALHIAGLASAFRRM